MCLNVWLSVGANVRRPSPSPSVYSVMIRPPSIVHPLSVCHPSTVHPPSVCHPFTVRPSVRRFPPFTRRRRQLCAAGRQLPSTARRPPQASANTPPLLKLLGVQSAVRGNVISKPTERENNSSTIRRRNLHELIAPPLNGSVFYHQQMFVCSICRIGINSRTCSRSQAAGAQTVGNRYRASTMRTHPLGC